MAGLWWAASGVVGWAQPPAAPPAPDAATQAEEAADEGETWRQGKFVWADLFTTDPATARTFYTELFGWTATQVGPGPESYVILRKEGEAVAGIARHPMHKPGVNRARWVMYASVTDLPDTVARATAAGGRVLLKPQAVAERGTLAVLADAQGAVIGVLHAEHGDDADYQAEFGEWNWASLLTRDPAQAKEFYSRVLGYDVVPDERTERPNDYVLASGGYARGSLQPLPDRPDAKPGWLGFVRVADVATAVRRAGELGGRVLLAPKEPRPGLKLAILADPVGATIGVVQITPPEEAASTEAAP